MGRTLGRYELVRPLARGGMAELFLARRRAPGGLEKRVVIKRIRRERAGDARFAALFVREARLSMSLSHKNIVPVFDFGRAGDELFLVMEYVEGVDLATVLGRVRQRGLRVDPMLVAYIGLEACQALEYAHQASGLDGRPQGVIHRDVTPANVLLSYSGEVKLLDFGIATSDAAVGEGGRAREQKVRGTPPYMAPEQARGEALSAATDVFSLGLVLWEALAGRRAYGGPDVRKVLAAARRGKVARLAPERAPAALAAILERATWPDRARRYPDAGAMQLALDEYLVDARAGLERRGPIHQVLAAWVRELFPDRDGGAAAPTTIALPDGPVATFLDDGEQQVTKLPPPGELGTERSLAETVADGAGGPTDADADVEEEGEDGRDDGERAASTVPGRAAAPGRAGSPAPGRAAAPDRAGSPAPAADGHPSGSPRRGLDADAPPGGSPRGGLRSPWTLAAAALAVAAIGVLFVARDLARRMPAGAATEPPAAPRAGSPPRSARVPDTAGAARENQVAAGEVPGAAEDPAGAAAEPPGPRAEQPDPPPRQQAVKADADARPAGAEPPPRARAEPPRRARGPSGTVRVSASPWAEVRVVGRPERCAETPCSMTLPAGPHTLTLRNPVARVGKSVRVVVRTDETVTVRETLTPGR